MPDPEQVTTDQDRLAFTIIRDQAQAAINAQDDMAVVTAMASIVGALQMLNFGKATDGHP